MRTIVRGLALAFAAQAIILVAFPTSQANANPKYAAIIINAGDGKVLFSRNADARRYPASLTKMMTLYMLFEELEAGRLTLTSQLPVSSTAASRPPSKLGVAPGSTIDVETVIKALAVKSANDIAAVVAEKLGGTEANFAAKMTQRAKLLGLTRTKFRNASGLPDRGQYTTARDMSILGQRIFQDFPQYYHYFALKSFTWKGRIYKTHNRILNSFQGADGIKTGYIRDSGFNVVTSAKRHGFHLIGVVMGGRTSRSRDDHMKLILTNQFARLQQDPSLAQRFAEIPTPLVKPAAIGSQPALLDESIIIATGPASSSASAKTASTELSLTSGLNRSEKDQQRRVAVASVSPLDPIGQLIAQSQGENPTRSADDALLKTAAKSEFQMLNPSDPLSPRIYKSDATSEIAYKANEQTVGIQVGAFRYEEVAVQRLNAVMTKVPSLRETQIAGIFPADVGGRTVYRVRIGPYRKEDAQTACEDLTAKGVSCYPVFKEEWPQIAKLVTSE